MAKYDEILMKFDRSQAKEDKLLIRIEKECRETIISRKSTSQAQVSKTCIAKINNGVSNR